MNHLNRRQFTSVMGASALAGGSLSSVRPVSASEEHGGSRPPLGKAEHCIMIWLGGGPAQIDTFDPKRKSKDGRKDPGSAYESIDTATPGVQVCEHLKLTAPLMDRVAPVRTLHHDEIDEHAAASYRMHVGRPTSGTVVYPSMGASISYMKEAINDSVPPYVLMGYPSPGRSPGFLGPQHGFVYLTETKAGPNGLQRPPRISQPRHERRLRLLEKLRENYAETMEQDQLISEYVDAERRGFKLAGPKFMEVFDLDNETADLRNSYGDEFGQRCLLARRLIERGTRFVEVSFNLNFVNGTGWDTHNQGQQKQHLLIQSLDRAFSSLITDLESKKLLDKTLLIIAGEFGRPAKFDGGGGRGHHAKAFTAVLAGGGLNTGQAIGETDELAMNALGERYSVPDWFATIYATLGINPDELLYAGDRPVPLTDRGTPIAKLFG